MSIQTLFTGTSILALIAAAVCALPLSLLFLWLYRRAVVRIMGTRSARASSAVGARSPAPGTQPAAMADPARIALAVVDAHAPLGRARPGISLYRRILRGPWRSVAIHGVAGVVFAVTVAILTLLSDNLEILPLRLTVLSWIFTWPLVLAILLLVPRSPGAHVATLLGYAGIGATITGIALPYGATFPGIAMSWVATNAVPTLFLLLFLNRRILAVGPLVFGWMLLAWAGAFLSPALLDSGVVSAALLAVGNALDLDPRAIFFGVAALVFAALGAVGWLAIAWLARSYEARQIGDQSITVDAVWLVFGIYYAVQTALVYPVWALAGLGAVAAYAIAARLGFRVLGAHEEPGRKAPSLLLLRVFALGKRSEPVFDAVTRDWRHAGHLSLIAGPDLARTTVEPPELVAFLRGKLPRLFVGSEQTLARRLAERDQPRDPDGRFRVDELFCTDDTWQLALAALAREADVVLMDLRGFAPDNAGCVHELHELVRLVPMERVVLLVDRGPRGTDLGFLEETLRHAWSAMPINSPNAAHATSGVTITALLVHRPDARALRHVVGYLCDAAARAGLDTSAGREVSRRQPQEAFAPAG